MITIFIPSFNHANYVVESIKSAQKINVKGKKIYVIDDASTDNSVAEIESYISTCERKDEIHFVAKLENKGVVDSLISFLDYCETEYAYLMASDDIVVPAGVERLIGIMEERNTLQFVIGGGTNLQAGGTKTHIYNNEHERFFALSVEERSRELYLNSPSPILSQSTVIRTQAIRSIGGWSRELIADDFAMFMKLLARFPERYVDFDFVPQVECVEYRHHPQNSYQDMVRQLNMTLQTLEALAPEDIKHKAIAKRFAFYIAFSLRKKKIASLAGLFSVVPKRYWFSGVIRTFLVLLNGLLKRAIS